MTYAVSCQYAHHDHSESVDLGVMGSSDVLRAFDEFDWSRQVVEANRLEKCAPTLSVTEPSTERLIWVSAYGDKSSLAFVSECKITEMKKKLFGSERPRVVELRTQTFQTSDARRALELFMSGADGELQTLYART